MTCILDVKYCTKDKTKVGKKIFKCVYVEYGVDSLDRVARRTQPVSLTREGTSHVVCGGRIF